MDLCRRTWRGRNMDSKQRERIEHLCTRIDMAMEDASSLAIETRRLADNELTQRLHDLGSTIMQMLELVREAKGFAA